MKNLYFDLQNGISGDMAVAALLALEGSALEGSVLEESVEDLRNRLKSINLVGYEIEAALERRNGIPGYTFNVHVGSGDQTPRDYRDIMNLIEKSGLNRKEKTLAGTIFRSIAEAEALIHGTDVDRVHFHEVGAVDSIIDIVSFSVLYNSIGAEHCRASEVYLGSGRTESKHGAILVPAPATVEIIKGLPVRGTGLPFELTTPTGAAIVKSVVGSFGPLPKCLIRNAGLGFGKRKSPGFNALRVLEYEEISELEGVPGGPVAVIDAEIAYLQERLFTEGVLDVYVTPVFMKKNRPAFNMSALCLPGDLERISGLILRESSTFGLRYCFMDRKVLDRKFERIETSFGPIQVKVGYLGEVPVKASPEFEDVRKAAIAHGVPLRLVFDEVRVRCSGKYVIRTPRLNTGVKEAPGEERVAEP
jgi:hypothetical protein